MIRLFFVSWSGVVLAVFALAAFAWPTAELEPLEVADSYFNVKRGAYLARISGCVACHTNEDGGGQPLAGGVALETKFGTFFSPNITPDPEFGIGDWSLEKFARALRQGISPDGSHYYPAFPYPFYTSLNDRDISDLWAAIQIVPPVAVQSKPHDVGFPFNIRTGLGLWKGIYLDDKGFVADKTKSTSWNRGKFIVEGLAHCGACHTPRNFAGARIASQALTGDPAMLDGGASPAIDPDSLRRKGWTKETLRTALKTGVLPDGDIFGGSMAEVVRHGTAYLLPMHLDDLATFLLDES